MCIIETLVSRSCTAYIICSLFVLLLLKIRSLGLHFYCTESKNICSGLMCDEDFWKVILYLAGAKEQWCEIRLWDETERPYGSPESHSFWFQTSWPIFLMYIHRLESKKGREYFLTCRYFKKC